MRPLFLVPLALAACSSEAPLPDLPDLPDCAVAAYASDTGEPRVDCTERLVWGPGCDIHPDTQLAQDGLIYAGQAEIRDNSGLTTLTITDEGTWEGFQGRWYEPPELPEVEFFTHVVVVAHHYFSSTCGAGITLHGLHQGALHAEFHDSSGGCVEHCDMAVDNWVIYAVPRGDTFPTVCARVLNTCD